MNLFEFVPGHKAIILAIPGMIPINSVVKPKRKKSQEYIQIQLINLLKKTLNDAAKINNRTNVDASMISSENIYEWSQANETESEAPIYKCRFLCPYCDKSYSVTYNRFWISNKVTKHIKQHMIE